MVTRMLPISRIHCGNWDHHAKLSQPSEIKELALAFLKNALKTDVNIVVVQPAREWRA